jgi:hypothetical protein
MHQARHPRGQIKRINGFCALPVFLAIGQSFWQKGMVPSLNRRNLADNDQAQLAVAPKGLIGSHAAFG